MIKKNDPVYLVISKKNNEPVILLQLDAVGLRGLRQPSDRLLKPTLLLLPRLTLAQMVLVEQRHLMSSHGILAPQQLQVLLRQHTDLLVLVQLLERVNQILIERGYDVLATRRHTSRQLRHLEYILGARVAIHYLDIMTSVFLGYLFGNDSFIDEIVNVYGKDNFINMFFFILSVTFLMLLFISFL